VSKFSATPRSEQGGRVSQQEFGGRCWAGRTAGRFVGRRTRGLFAVVVLGAGLGIVNAAAQKATGNADADLRPLAIHGPYVVGPSQLALISQRSGNDPETDVPAGQPHSPCPGCLLGRNDGTFTLPNSPPPTSSFAADRGLGQEDPGLAVGASTVLVASRNVVAAYDRVGNLVGAKSGGPAFPNPFLVDDLFDNTTISSLRTDINSALQLPPGLPSDVTVANGFGLSKGAHSGGSYGDTRVAYDQYRKRFVIMTMGINNNVVDLILGRCTFKDSKGNITFQYNDGECGAKGIANFPALKFARRDYVLVAVSRTEDIRDGFFLYWWEGGIDQTTCLTEQGCPKQGYGRAYTTADFPTIAISESDLLISIGSSSRDGSKFTGNVFLAQQWLDCTPHVVCGEEVFQQLQSIPAQGLATGFGKVDSNGNRTGTCSGGAAAGPGCFGAWRYGLPVDGKHRVYSTKVVRPAMSAGQTTSQFGYFASAMPFGGSPFDFGCHCAHLHVWTLDTAPSTPSLNVKASEIAPYPRINAIGFFITNAVVQSGQTLAAGFMEPVGWLYDHLGVRVVEVQLGSGPANNVVMVDRTLRNGNVHEDGVGGIDYSWPAVGLNAAGDIVAGYMRSSKNLPLELRYS
jgi:hypothetical protein